MTHHRARAPFRGPKAREDKRVKRAPLVTETSNGTARRNDVIDVRFSVGGTCRGSNPLRFKRAYVTTPSQIRHKKNAAEWRLSAFKSKFEPELAP